MNTISSYNIIHHIKNLIVTSAVNIRIHKCIQALGHIGLNERMNEWMNECMNGVLGHLCAHRLNWSRRTSWGWWDEWDDTVFQTQDSKFESRRSDSELATSRSRRLPTILNLYKWAGKKHFVSLKLECQSGARTCDLRLSKQAALTTAPVPSPYWTEDGQGTLIHRYQNIYTAFLHER